MAGSTPAIVPSASSTDEATTLEIKNTCLEAVNGDEAAEISCIKTILEHAEPMSVDELVADFQTNCLVIPTLRYGHLIWAYLGRSDKRRVGKECGSKRRSRWCT